MAFGKNHEFDIERIKKIIEDEKYIVNSKLESEEVAKIYKNYSTFYYSGNLENIKNEILDLLNKNLPESVHSVRGRVKNPDHLIEKIYRKSFLDPSKYEKVSEDNYNKLITDLIGIRIIIMDKRDWRVVHNKLLTLFNNDSSKYIKNSEDLIRGFKLYKSPKEESDNDKKIIYHAEKPVVYAISEDDLSLYVDDNLVINRSKENYRSIHYIIRYGDLYFEIQVRTLFEEGWLEFDHRIKYPYDNGNEKKKEYASILNSLAQTADKLISFYDENDFKRTPKKKTVKNEQRVEQLKKESSTIKDKLISMF